MDLFHFDFSNETQTTVLTTPTSTIDTESIKQTINQRRRQLTVHSCIYYSYGTSIISDNQWDKWAKELVQLQRDYPEIAAMCDEHEEFKDFDGTTGFNLPYNRAGVHSNAKWLIEQHKAMESKN